MDETEVFRTAAGTPYLKSPKVICLSKPKLININENGLGRFLGGFDESLQFGGYLSDFKNYSGEESSALCKLAGQVCYGSFGVRRTPHTSEGNNKYFKNIKDSGHGSVVEHANFSFLMYGISRALTHELIRHRAGWAYSQLSQRFVDGKLLRFVESERYQTDPQLHRRFEDWIDRCAEEYKLRQGRLLLMRNPDDHSTDGRKSVNQEARRCLPNETETFLMATANARAIRHVLEMRASLHADDEIRRWALAVYAAVKPHGDYLFDDYELKTDPTTGKQFLETQYKKV